MLNFPAPYSDELVYSLVARAGVHFGISSPKELLDEVYGSRKVIATVDLPCHLKKLSSNYPTELGVDSLYLAYNHTLFPIYAPFIPEGRRQQCLKWMGEKSYGAAHLALGVAASRVKQPEKLRYCPKCLQDQLEKYGEYYWARRWQINGADCCLEHGCILESPISRHGYHRHLFVAASPELCKEVAQKDSGIYERRVTRIVEELLLLPPTPSPEYVQWSVFYNGLARELFKTKNVYEEIKTKVINNWSGSWLNIHSLYPDDSQSCWLRSIFRKHRKSFSYLEHIIVLDALLSADWKISDVIKEVSGLPKEKKKVLISGLYNKVSYEEIRTKRNQWVLILGNYGVKRARYLGGGAIYSWLYRHDYEWLMKINKRYKKSYPSKNNRVNWRKRDLSTLAKLTEIQKISEELLNSPRRTKNWYVLRMLRSSTVSKNIDKLPLTRLFLQRHCEDVSDYQIRRIKTVISKLQDRGAQVTRWRICRIAGLSEKRLKIDAKQYLDQVFGEDGQLYN